MEIRTNNIPRLIIDAYQLTDKERKEFNYLDWEAISEGRESASFFRYKGQVYDLGEFMLAPSPVFEGWHGYSSGSAFHGVLVKYTEDMDHVIVAQYFC